MKNLYLLIWFNSSPGTTLKLWLSGCRQKKPRPNAKTWGHIKACSSSARQLYISPLKWSVLQMAGSGNTRNDFIRIYLSHSNSINTRHYKVFSLGVRMHRAYQLYKALPVYTAWFTGRRFYEIWTIRMFTVMTPANLLCIRAILDILCQAFVKPFRNMLYFTYLIIWIFTDVYHGVASRQDHMTWYAKQSVSLWHYLTTFPKRSNQLHDSLIITYTSCRRQFSINFF